MKKTIKKMLSFKRQKSRTSNNEGKDANVLSRNSCSSSSSGGGNGGGCTGNNTNILTRQEKKPNGGTSSYSQEEIAELFQQMRNGGSLEVELLLEDYDRLRVKQLRNNR